ncbi:MAG TPA: hypothetical protein VJN18_11460 [Polyangiaceae bacterium]|nr:hypothetical protein [Polyangiaceae bacterium]
MSLLKFLVPGPSETLKEAYCERIAGGLFERVAQAMREGFEDWQRARASLPSEAWDAETSAASRRAEELLWAAETAQRAVAGGVDPQSLQAALRDSRAGWALGPPRTSCPPQVARAQRLLAQLLLDARTEPPGRTRRATMPIALLPNDGPGFAATLSVTLICDAEATGTAYQHPADEGLTFVNAPFRDSATHALAAAERVARRSGSAMWDAFWQVTTKRRKITTLDGRSASAAAFLAFSNLLTGRKPDLRVLVIGGIVSADRGYTVRNVEGVYDKVFGFIEDPDAPEVDTIVVPSGGSRDQATDELEARRALDDVLAERHLSPARTEMLEYVRVIALESETWIRTDGS